METEDYQAITPACRIIKALEKQDSLKRKIEATSGKIPDFNFRLTCSIGIANYDFAEFHENNVEILLNRSEKALQSAKNNGKNCVRLWYDLPESKIL